MKRHQKSMKLEWTSDDFNMLFPLIYDLEQSTKENYIDLLLVSVASFRFIYALLEAYSS